ncbi:MAG TPA: DUF3298 domain-containing protein [Parafilimonas sp.]|nr:DUF3298 domain-containing protein [Parafilimonas sp.]
MSIPATAQVSWYKCFSGKIDKYDVTVHLHQRAHQYTGYYYYNSTQQPVFFIGEDSTTDGTVKLTVFVPGGQTEENFAFSINGNSCTGNWTNSTGKTLSFSANEITQTPVWDYIFTKGSVQLRPKLKNSPVAGYEAASVWPDGNTEQMLFLKKTINEWFAKDTSATDIGQLFLKRKKEFFEGYLSDNKNVADSELVDAYSFNMEEIQTINIAYQSTELLTLANSSYSYTGGAHGNYATGYMSIDMAKNKKLSLDDILSASGKSQLRRLLEKYFRREYNVKDNEALTEGGLFENKIEPNKNFFITGKSIGFSYAPYEIGPYALGEIVIFIPLNELKVYMRTDFKNLVTID